MKFRDHLISRGWKPYESDPCIFSRHTPQYGHEFVGIYVDDCIHLCSSAATHKDFLKTCNEDFPTTSQGPLHWILGIHITRNKSSRTLCLHQTQAIISYLDEHGLTELRPRDHPMPAGWKYGDEPVYTDPDLITQYRSQVGSLNFFSQATRPDISFAVSILCRHLSTPNAACFRALKHLNSYLAHTPHLGLVYTSSNTKELSISHITTDKTPTTSDPIKLKAYCDANWGGESVDNAKSTSGNLIYFGDNLISWSSKLQSTIALSSAEAEHNSAFNAARTIVYFRQFLQELGMKQNSSTVIHEDNQACIAQSKNPVNHQRNRHVLLRYHYLRDIVDQGHATLQYIKTKDQLADVMTKALPSPTFNHFLPSLVNKSPLISSSTTSSPASN